MSESAIPWRLKIGVVVAGYASVLVLAALMIVRRYLAGLRDPDMFSGGMGAGGDWMLELMLVGLFFIPTFVLALMMRNSEAAYTKFARVLLGFGISGPMSLALMAIPAVGQTNSLLGSVCLYRTFAFPMSLFGLIGFCLLAKFKRPRRLILYSVLIEVGTVIFMMAMLKVAGC